MDVATAKLSTNVDRSSAGPLHHAPLAARLTSISKSVRQFVNLRLAPLGIVSGQEQFLLLLLEVRSASTVSIADALAVRPSTVSKMADILAKSGWVIRQADAADKRRVFLRLTQKGTLVAEKAKSLMIEIEQELGPLLSDVAKVETILKQIDAGLYARLRRLR